MHVLRNFRVFRPCTHWRSKELGGPALGGPLDFAHLAHPIATPLISPRKVFSEAFAPRTNSTCRETQLVVERNKRHRIGHTDGQIEALPNALALVAGPL